MGFFSHKKKELQPAAGAPSPGMETVPEEAPRASAASAGGDWLEDDGVGDYPDSHNEDAALEAGPEQSEQSALQGGAADQPSLEQDADDNFLRGSVASAGAGDAAGGAPQEALDGLQVVESDSGAEDGSKLAGGWGGGRGGGGGGEDYVHEEDGYDEHDPAEHPGDWEVQHTIQS